MKNIAQKTKNNKQMSEIEIKEFLKSLLMEANYEHYALDGFLFLFKTFSEMAESNKVNLIDLFDDLQRFIYIESIHCNLMQDVYVSTIAERYRKTDYEEKTVKVYQAIQKEVETAAKPLDLSNCSIESLSKGLSDLMHNPKLPERLHNCLADELADLTNGQSDSPEIIAKAIQNNEK